MKLWLRLGYVRSPHVVEIEEYVHDVFGVAVKCDVAIWIESDAHARRSLERK
jgi:hypothetical protein